MKYRCTSILLMVLLCLVASVKAQNSIKGKVVDAKSRQPLETALVADADMPINNTITDSYGNFLLKTGKEKANLIISSLGYKPVSVEAGAQGDLKIALEADALSLKDVVLLSSNHTSKFSSLTKIDLDLKPVRNTQELLGLVPGLFIAQHAGGGKAEQIFLRGFDVDHGTDVKISVDGMPVNMVSHAHGQGYADLHFVIPETINNIDFGAGPYYAQQGNLNTAGYVSLSTFNNITSSRMQVEAGRYNTFRTLAMLDLLKKNKDKQSAYVAAEYNYTNGPTIGKQKFNRFNLLAKYNLAISPVTQLSASASTFKSKWNASGQVPDRAVVSGQIDRFGSIDDSEGGNTERLNANITLGHTFSGGTKWENQVFYSRYKFSLFSNFTFFLNNPVEGDGINQQEGRNIFGYNSKLNHQYYFNDVSLQSTYGAGVRSDATKDSRLANTVRRRFLENTKLGNIKETNAFAFVQQQLTTGNWLFDAGVRLDYFHFNYEDKLTTQQLASRQKSIVSPKLNIQYTLNKGMQLFVKTGKGFHSNDARVVVANDGKQILPAAYGADAGVILKPNSKTFINLAAWYLYLDQEFVYVGDAGVVEPSGKTRRQGVDVIARYQFTKNLFANLNINFTKPRAIGEPKNQDYIPLAPDFTSIGGLFYKAQTGFNGGVNYRYIKNRPANEDNSVVAKGYFILDAAVNYSKPKYEIGIAVENMLNVKWNEAQFATESQLMAEANPVNELHYTPGTPIFARIKLAVFF